MSMIDWPVTTSKSASQSFPSGFFSPTDSIVSA